MLSKKSTLLIHLAEDVNICKNSDSDHIETSRLTRNTRESLVKNKKFTLPLISPTWEFLKWSKYEFFYPLPFSSPILHLHCSLSGQSTWISEKFLLLIRTVRVIKPHPKGPKHRENERILNLFNFHPFIPLYNHFSSSVRCNRSTLIIRRPEFINIRKRPHILIRLSQVY